MTLIPDVFPEIRLRKISLDKCQKRPCLRGLLEKEHGKCDETLLQSEWEHL